MSEFTSDYVLPKKTQKRVHVEPTDPPIESDNPPKRRDSAHEPAQPRRSSRTILKKVVFKKGGAGDTPEILPSNKPPTPMMDLTGTSPMPPRVLNFSDIVRPPMTESASSLPPTGSGTDVKKVKPSHVMSSFMVGDPSKKLKHSPAPAAKSRPSVEESASTIWRPFPPRKESPSVSTALPPAFSPVSASAPASTPAPASGGSVSSSSSYLPVFLRESTGEIADAGLGEGDVFEEEAGADAPSDFIHSIGDDVAVYTLAKETRKLRTGASSVLPSRDGKWYDLAREMIEKERTHREAMLENPLYNFLTHLAARAHIPMKKLVIPAKTYRDTSQWRTQYPKAAIDLLTAINSGSVDSVANRLGDMFAAKCIDEASEKMNENELRKQMYLLINENLVESRTPEITDHARGLVAMGIDFCKTYNRRLAPWTLEDYLKTPTRYNVLIKAIIMCQSEDKLIASTKYVNRARIELNGIRYLEAARDIRKLGGVDDVVTKQDLLDFSIGY